MARACSSSCWCYVATLTRALIFSMNRAVRRAKKEAIKRALLARRAHWLKFKPPWSNPKTDLAYVLRNEGKARPGHRYICGPDCSYCNPEPVLAKHRAWVTQDELKDDWWV